MPRSLDERSLRILIVDDVDEMLEMLKQAFQGSSRIQVSGTARNGAEARNEIYRNRPDLVLLDEILPGESSTDLLEEFVADGLPVLLMTGVENPSHSIPKGALGRVGKPGWGDFAAEIKELEKSIGKFYAMH